MPVPSYVVEISFGSSGYVDVSQYVQSVTIDRGISRVLEDYSAGSLSITFVNNNRVFDPLNTSSPLYSTLYGYTLVQPGGRVRVKANNIVRFTGFIQDWSFTYDQAGLDGKATLTALDEMYRVGNAVFTGGYAWQVESTTDRMRTVLNYNGFGAAEYSEIKTGHTLLGADQWQAGDSVLSYLQQVARSEPGDFYSNASAVMVFKDRSFTNYNWTNSMRYNFVAYPQSLAGTTAPDTTIKDDGEGTYQWVVLGSRATATASQFGGTVFAGGTVAGVIPSEDFIGFSYTNLNPARYANTGNSYVFSGYLRGNSGTYDGSIQLLDSAGGLIASSAISTASAGSAAWTRIGGVLTNSSTSIVAGVGFSFGITQATATTGTTMRGEGFLVEPGTAFTNYFDGGYSPSVSSAGTVYEVAWAGDPYASMSGLLTSTAATASAPAILSFADVNSQATVGGTGIPFTELTIAYGSENLYNQVQVIGVNATAIKNDTTGQSRYGLKTYSQTDNLTTSLTKPSEIAASLLAEWRLPEYRAEDITLALESLTSAQQNLVLAVELRDVVRVCFKPSNSGDVVDKYYQVLGIRGNTDVERDSLTFTLGSLDNAPIRLDSTLLAILNTDTLG